VFKHPKTKFQKNFTTTFASFFTSYSTETERHYFAATRRVHWSQKKTKNAGFTVVAWQRRERERKR